MDTYRRYFRVFKQPVMDTQLSMLLVAIIIGLLGGYGAVLFRFVIKLVQYLFYRNSADILTFAHSISPYFLIGMPALGGLIVGMSVHFGAREAKGHGVPEVIEAIVLRDGHIRKRVAFVKIMASAVCIGSGGSVGREGPIVQIGSSIGSSVGQLLKFGRARQKTLVGCGAAAGIAATFNAPIAGVLFALEILLGDFGLSAFSPVVLSSVMATTISRHYFGNFPAFIIPAYELRTLWEFLIYPFLGLTAGLVSLVFITLLYKCEDIFDAVVRIPEYIKPALGGLILGLILIRWPQVFGVGYGAINLSLTNKIYPLLLLSLIGIKIMATSITIGSGGSGGIFAPSLFIGAMTGGFFGWCVGALFPELTASPGAYALVGMGALVAGTTHAPITAILIIFELTNDYKIILPLMMSCIISTLLASYLKKGSIYTIKLMRRNLDITGGFDQNILRTLLVREFMSRDTAIVSENATVAEIIEVFRIKDASYLHVIDANNQLAGIISFRDIRRILGQEESNYHTFARDIATTDVITVTPADNIQVALQLMSSKGISQLPVVKEKNSRDLIGDLREKDLLAAYDKAVLRREIEIT
ncbi:MAG: chloride channel protein [Deltaproteobacteria bacterium]|nr:chloride channel protein [Deltaproteobacteria bacterium]